MAVARQLVAQGAKGRALLALKRRALQEQQLAKLEAWLLNVEEMVGECVCVEAEGGWDRGGWSLVAVYDSVPSREAPGRK